MTGSTIKWLIAALALNVITDIFFSGPLKKVTARIYKLQVKNQ